jgi:hypothetical protein
MPATTAGACDASGEMGLFASTRVSDDVKRTINTDVRDHATTLPMSAGDEETLELRRRAKAAINVLKVKTRAVRTRNANTRTASRS